MRELIVRFEMENAAFGEGNANAEAARALRIIAGKAESGQDGGMVWDSNGNRIGEWSAEWPEPEEAEEDADCPVCGAIPGCHEEGCSNA